MTALADRSQPVANDATTQPDERLNHLLAMARFRRAWLAEKRLTCSSRGCHCRTTGPRHSGLYLRWRQGRRRYSLYVRPHYADQVRKALVDGRHSRRDFLRSIRSFSHQVDHVVDAYLWLLDFEDAKAAGRKPRALPRSLRGIVETAAPTTATAQTRRS